MIKKIFLKDDGSLKAGRVAFCVFIALICVSALMFQFSKPVDNAIVAVKHVFEPDPVTEEESPPKENKEEAAESQPPASVPSPVEANPASQARVQVDPPTPGPADAPEKAQKPGPESNEANNEPASEKTSKEPVATSTNEPPASAVSPQQSPEGSAQPAMAALKIGEQAEEKDIQFKALSIDPQESATGITAADKNCLRMEKEDYESIYREWRQSGRSGGEGGFMLRIENLKQVYPLLQMKAVALLDGKPYMDLADGTRLAQTALEDYASTCFMVSDPFEKWGRELSESGLRSSQNIEVRYYMYDFIRNAIYARAGHAIDCYRQKGEIPPDIDLGKVDLLGRAYTIEREGGGCFGVFVPRRIDLPDGRSVPVDPTCFPNSRDVQSLLAAGLIQ